MRVMVTDHGGKSHLIASGLATRGCELVDDAQTADVILIDHDVPTHGKLAHAEACVAAGGRAFLYPHGAGAGVIAGWDGLFPVSPIVSGLFANGPGHAETARRFGYPHPVHDIGWTFGELRPRRRSGRVGNVVFAAQHPKGDGHLSDWKVARNRDIFDRLRATPAHLVVRYIGTLEQNGLPLVDGVEYIQASLDDTAGQIAQIDAADVVVSDRATFSCLAIARGVTTVMFDSTVIARDLDRSHLTDNIDLYREHIRFPFDAEDGVDIWELMNAAAQDVDLVGEWRSRFIGGAFDVDALLEVLHGDGVHLLPQRRAKRLRGAALASVGRGDEVTAERLLAEAVAGCVDLELLNDLAVVRWNLGRHDEAEALLRGCLALDANHLSATENLSELTTARDAETRSIPSMTPLIPAAPTRPGLDDLVTHQDSGVYVLPQEGTAATYLDGAERYLLDSLRSVGDVSVFSPELRPLVRDWASLYHLTPYRGTILDALGLSAPEARVLELGAGCGAVTRWLGERFDRVDAVEGSFSRACVARERCRDLPGVRVAAANFFDLDFGGAFDLATLIGVLEYSHLYHPEFGDDPARAALSNLELVRGSLREDGTLIVAIENKLGLKYLSGSHEDHAGRRFEGIEGYPSRSSAVTFSAAELERMLLAAGFSGVDFYLPFPDYKLAHTMLDAANADASTYPANWIETPFPDRTGQPNASPFNESLALREVVSAGLLRDLANSFVVLAYNGDRERSRRRLGVEDGWAARHYSLDRRPAFCKRASLERTGDGELVVRNTSVVTDAPAVPDGHLLVQRLADEPFRAGHQAQFELFEHAAAGKLLERLPALLEQMRDFLLAGYDATCVDQAGVPLLRGDALDVTWWNVIVEPGTGAWHSIDGEWRFAGLLPLDYVVWRGLLHAGSRRPELLAGSGTDNPTQFALAAVMHLYPALDQRRLALYQELEEAVQRAAGADISGRSADAPSPQLSELIAFGGTPQCFQVLAFAEELIAHPELLATYTAAFATGEPATLVAYAPDGEPDEIAARLGAALAGATGSDPDVVLVADAREPEAERQLAGSVQALLSLAPAAEPFAELVRVGSDDGARLRSLAFPAAAEAAEAGSESRPSGQRVSIVIPTFNRLDLTQECLRGIAETAPGADVIVADNGSTDGTREFLLAEQGAGRLRCLLNEENLGFSRACNNAAALSDREFVLMLNNDIEPRQGWLDAMVGEFDDPTVGIVGSRLLFPDGRIQHAGVDFKANTETEHLFYYGAGDDPAVLTSRDIPVVTGAALMVRRSLFEALGGFDEGYWMYVEDVDLCMRAWHAGYRVRYCADSVLVHHQGSSSPDMAWCIAHVVEGWKRFHERWLGRMPEALLRLTRVPDALAQRRRFVVIARADELMADERLLAAYSSLFDGRDEVTLRILGGLQDGEVVAGLVAAVAEAGLGAAGAAHVEALPRESAAGEQLLACGADAVLSRAGVGGAFAKLPLFDDRIAVGLRALVRHSAARAVRAATVATHA